MRANVYRHSGRFALGGVLLALVAGLAAAIVLAFAYAYLLAYIPVVGYVTFIIAGGFGYLVGYATGKLLEQGHVRNTPLSILVTAVAALGAFYASWVVWIHAIAGRADVEVPILDLATSPAILWEVVTAVNAEGAWSLKGWTPTGTILWIFWILEAGLIFGPAFYAVHHLIHRRAYCEACGKWCHDTLGAVQLDPSNPADLRQRLETSDFAALSALPNRQGGTPTWTRVDLHLCPTAQCGKTNAVSVSHVSTTVNRKGEPSEKVDTLVDKILIDRATVDLIRGLNQRAVEQVA